MYNIEVLPSTYVKNNVRISSNEVDVGFDSTRSTPSTRRTTSS